MSSDPIVLEPTLAPAADAAVALPLPRNQFQARWSSYGFRPVEIVPGILALGFFAFVVTVALRIPFTYDVGLAYQGGQAAWQTGHPESVYTWISTPFLAMVMAVASRLMSESAAATLDTVINCLLFLAAGAVIWNELRGRITRRYWWATLLAFVAFAPIASSIFWIQFNIIAFALAAAGWQLASRRPWLAGLLVALSIGIKPLALLLPVALLWRPQTRRSGLWSIGWGGALLAISQAFLAWRAHDWHNLSPLAQLKSLANHSTPAPYGWVCYPDNFSLESLWCRISGTEYWKFKSLAVTLAVLGVAALSAHLVSKRAPGSWAVFAFVCLLSPMLSPIAWSHYQILFIPMFLVLAYEFVTVGADIIDWTALVSAFALSQLVWQPFGTIPGMVRHLLTGKLEGPVVEINVFVVAALAQFVLLGAAFLWFMRRPQAAGTSLKDW